MINVECNSVWIISEIFFFKQKTAYEMRISDWSSDVCSSDLHVARLSDRAEAAVAERTDQRLQIGFVDRRCRIAEREPFEVAFVHFLPIGEFVGHRERKDFDIIHDRRAVRPALPKFIDADRRRADRAAETRLRSEEGRVGKECDSQFRSRW